MERQFDYLKQIEQGMQGMRNETWQCVLAHIPVPAAQILLRQHGQLLAISDREARIRISSEPLRKLALDKRPAIETGFRKALGHTIKVSLEV